MKVTADKVRAVKDKKTMTCPKCGKDVKMDFIEASMGFGVYNISLVNYKYNWYTICPECHALFAVEQEKAQESAKNKSTASVTADDLIFLKDIPVK